MNVFYFCLLSGLIGFSRVSHAVTWNIQNQFSARYMYSSFKNDNLSLYEAYGSSFIHDVVQLNLTGDRFSADIRPELRFLSTYELDEPKDSPAYASARGPVRLLNTEGTLYESNNQQVFTDFERLFVTYQSESLELKIGRTPLGIGSLRALTLWNRFSPTLLNQTQNDLVFNPDLFLAKVQYGDINASVIDVEDREEENKIRLLHLVWYSPLIELHSLLGEWWTQPTAGLAFVTDIGGLAVRGESLFIQETDERLGENQFALGLEYAFTARLSALVEGLYFDRGASHPDDYTSQPLSKFRPLVARGYTYSEISYQVTDFTKFSLGDLLNWVDGSSLVTLNATHSLTSDMDIAFEARIPVGGESQEFGHINRDDDGSMYIGYPERYRLALHWVF